MLPKCDYELKITLKYEFGPLYSIILRRETFLIQRVFCPNRGTREEPLRIEGVRYEI